MDIITYALCKKLVAGVASGISGFEVNGTKLIIHTSNGQTLEIDFPTPKDGTSIVNAQINEKNHLICSLSDGSEIDAGEIKTVQGPKGDPFKYEDFTEEQLEALKGKDGLDGVDGISIIDTKIEDNHLFCTLSNGTVIDAGEIKVDSISLNFATNEDIDNLFKDLIGD